MKRILLFSVVCLIATALSGQSKFATITGPNKDLKLPEVYMHPDQVQAQAASSVIGMKSYNNTILGTTWYDSQTVNYGNVMQRIWSYNDGTVGATWQCSGEGSVPDRGTGYNYFDGTSWDEPLLHLGDVTRTGWPSYAPWGPNGEIISHYEYIANAGPIHFFKREIKGQGDWIETELTNPNNVSLVWQSMITSGENNEYIHLLAYTYDAVYQGQTNALLYYRSSDGAETWEIDGVVIDGLGQDYYPTIKALNYAWANPVGNTIAFVYGPHEFGGWVFKSEDNGDSWEMIQVTESPIDPFNVPADFPVVPCGIGTAACALDNNGMVHVVFPRSGKLWEAGTMYYRPYTDGLIYWNESMPVLDTTIMSSYTMDFLAEAGNLCGWVLATDPNYTILSGQPDYANSLCAYPQLSIDAENNIFVASSVLAPDYNNGEFFYRHILANSSFDGGATWVGQIDINTDIQYIFSECAFPAMAPVIQDYVHVLFQEDALPGINQWLANHDPVENRMMHIAIDKDVFVGVRDNIQPSSFDLSQSFPNPASSIVYLTLNLEQETDISQTLVNLVAQTVKDYGKQSFRAGKNMIKLDVSDLPAGVYNLVLSGDGKQAVRKIVVR
jgi:hypothetical protein